MNNIILISGFVGVIVFFWISLFFEDFEVTIKFVIIGFLIGILCGLVALS